MNTEDLNRLIRELNSQAVSDASETSPTESEAKALSFTSDSLGIEFDADRFKLYLTEMVQRSATDLLLVPGAPPSIRINSILTPLGYDPLDPKDVLKLIGSYISEDRKKRFIASGAVDLAIALSQGRFRINVHRVQNGFAAAIRLLPKIIPSLSELGLPAALENLVRLNRGLVLVTGPTGCGKSTTLAALVNLINANQKRHIVTIEDPVEYEHAHRNSIVEQIEVGTDSLTFVDALRSALRQDPDVILVGEMRDLETVRTVLTAAETGHLVLTTLHTNDAVQTIHRIVDVFPAEQQPQIRQQLSLALTAIIYQQLVPTKNETSRVVACEVLIANDPVRNHIRTGMLHHLHTEMTLGRRIGMMTLEDSLASLVKGGFISENEAKNRATFPDELNSYLKP